MIKFTATNDWNFDVESVAIVTDRQQLTKRASAREFLKFAKTKGQTDLHIIALGAYEGTGFNRNGDGFWEEDCIKNHKHFQEADRAVHRNHKNKPTDPKYGNIKAAAYNKPMKRVELVVGLDNDKCADILDEQEKTGNTNWSMASKQAYDSCTWCDHKAKTDDDRCEHIPSKIGEMDKEGRMCGMKNPNPKWFEVSFVKRGADRIGMSLKKLAAAGDLKPMLTRDYLQIYTGFVPPEEELYISKKASDKRFLLQKLAEMEKHVEAVGNKPSGEKLYLARHARKLSKSEKMDDKTIDELRKYDPKKILRILADHGIVFSPEDFCGYIFGGRVSGKQVKGMKTHLPDIFRSLFDGEEKGEVVNNEKYEPSSMDMIPKEMRKMVEGLFDGHSLFGGPAVKRVMRITIMMPNAKEEKAEPKTKEAFDHELAKQYAAYKLAALNYMNDNNKLDDEVVMNAVVQNL